MQSFHHMEETLCLTSDSLSKILTSPLSKMKETASHTACLKYLEISAGLGEEHPQWRALELLDNYVRDQMAECDSLMRILNHLE